MKKLWAIICVVGYTGFWTFGFIAISGLFGDRGGVWYNLLFCLAGLGVGTYARIKIMGMTPRMHGRRAAARARLEAEYQESLS